MCSGGGKHHEKELGSLGGQLQGDALEQVDVVPQNLLVFKIKGQRDEVIDMIVATHIVQGRCASQILN